VFDERRQSRLFGANCGDASAFSTEKQPAFPRQRQSNSLVFTQTVEADRIKTHPPPPDTLPSSTTVAQAPRLTIVTPGWVLGSPRPCGSPSSRDSCKHLSQIGVALGGSPLAKWVGGVVGWGGVCGGVGAM